MAKKLYEETNIYNIACALREKCGDESKTYKTCDMADAIRALDTSGGGSGEEGPAWNDFSGRNLNTLGAKDTISHIINYYGDKIIMRDMIGSCNGLFLMCDELTNTNFDIYWEPNQQIYVGSNGAPFSKCTNITRIPYLYNAYGITTASGFSECHKLREIPDDWTDTWRGLNYCTWSGNLMFEYCYSLRKVPAWVNTRFTEYGVTTYSSMFYNCASLDEVLDLPILTGTSSTYSSNTFYNCARLKRFTFAVNEDGTPKTYIGKSATIDMSSCGYCSTTSQAYNILNYNSGITADKEVTAANYATLKDDPDYWTQDVAYSRYNHTSAVETINSLPDASANTSSHTIKFKGEAGSATDGGAINTLTEEEIAVATAKGWTVSYV